MKLHAHAVHSSVPAVLTAISLFAALFSACDGHRDQTVDGTAAPESGYEEASAACQAGDAAQCEYLGRCFRYGTAGAPKDYAMARQAFLRACAADIPAACTGMMDMVFEIGDEPAPDPATKEEMDALKKVCLQGNPAVCVDLFRAWDRQEEFPPIDAETARVLDLICDFDNVKYCVDAARALETHSVARPGPGDPFTLPAEPVFGVTLVGMYDRACKLGDEFSCLWGSNPEQAVPGLLPNMAAELSYFSLLLTAGESAEYKNPFADDDGPCERAECASDWASDLDFGVGDILDVDRITGECRRGDRSACLEAALRLAGDSFGPYDFDAVGALIASACQRGSRTACLVKSTVNRNGGWYPDGSGLFRIGVSQCERGDGDGCLAAAVVQGTSAMAPVDGKVTDGYLRRGCDLGNFRACILRAYTFENSWMDRAGDSGPENDPADHVDYWLARACESGMAASCTAAGLNLAGDLKSLDTSDVWEMEIPELREAYLPGSAGVSWFLRKGCDGGDPVGCYYLAKSIDDTLTSDRDPAQARVLYARACDLEHLDACGRLATMLLTEDGGPADPVRARALFGFACDRGKAEGCAELAVMLDSGIGGPADSGAALETARNASLIRAGDECYGIVTDRSASDSYLDDGPVSGCNMEYSARHCLRACRFGNQQACLTMARNWYYGCSDDSHLEMAGRIAMLACEAGNGAGCSIGAEALGQGMSGAELKDGPAFDMYVRACRMGAGDACLELVSVPGFGFDPATIAEVRARLAGSCVGGDAVACSMVDDFKVPGSKPSDPRMLRHYYGIGCAMNDIWCCRTIGEMWLDGTGGPADRALAIAQIEYACDNDNGLACLKLAELADKGLIDHDDPEYAARKLNEACEADIGPACRILGLSPNMILPNEYDEQVSPGDLLDRACGLDDAIACYESGRHMESATQIETIDRVLLRTTYERGCGLDHAGSCREYGHELARMTTGPGNGNGNRADGDSDIGDAADQTSDMTPAITAWEKGCRLGDGEACNALGVEEIRSGVGDGKARFERGCRGKGVAVSARACFNLTRVDDFMPMSEAIRLLSGSCTAGEPVACVAAAAMAVTTDVSGAWLLFARGALETIESCRDDGVQACLEMALWNAANGDQDTSNRYRIAEQVARDAVCDDRRDCAAAELLTD